MNTEAKILVLVLVAIAIDRLCTFLPSGLYFDPFPLYDLIYCYAPDDCQNVGINAQAYCKAITVHLSWIMFLFTVRLARPQLSKTLLVMGVIEVLSLADFFIIYEQPFFNIGNYHGEFTDIRILGHIITIVLWKTGRL